MRPMNGAKPNARDLIDRIMADERFQASSHFSDRVYRDEPILTTGRAMASYLPDRYRAMRSISRWEAGADGQRGRWLTEAELFYRQGMFMADFEDDCPYHGVFKSYFPTYSAMSDRQLRGYFTWHAAVRRGAIEETSLSFAFVYLYELICGIGVKTPEEGFAAIESFWQTYRCFAPEIDRFAGVWLQDYVVYHGLPARLLEPYKTLAFDRALIDLRHADAEAAALAIQTRGSAAKRKRGESALPLPPRDAFEQRLFSAIDALSTYHLAGSRLYRQEPQALRHVACAVFVRMGEYHRKHRSGTLLEAWFGEEVALAYTMFGSAVFFDPNPPVEARYELDEIHRYRCSKGTWTCERHHGGRSKSPKLGSLMRAVDRTLRLALDFEHPLKDDGKTAKYVQKIIDDEVLAWTRWSESHAPRRIEIDLRALDGIRATAAATREALLIDEERTGEGSLLDAADGSAQSAAPSSVRAEGDPGDGGHACGAGPFEAECPYPTGLDASEHPHPTGLSDGERAYLIALIEGDAHLRASAVAEAARSEDLLVDAINEALFDQMGDTVLEYGDAGPELIEDYLDDVKELLGHA